MMGVEKGNRQSDAEVEDCCSGSESDDVWDEKTPKLIPDDTSNLKKNLLVKPVETKIGKTKTIVKKSTHCGKNGSKGSCSSRKGTVELRKKILEYAAQILDQQQQAGGKKDTTLFTLKMQF